MSTSTIPIPNTHTRSQRPLVPLGLVLEAVRTHTAGPDEIQTFHEDDFLRYLRDLDLQTRYSKRTLAGLHLTGKGFLYLCGVHGSLCSSGISSGLLNDLESVWAEIYDTRGMYLVLKNILD